ncbi:MAG: hypothetical protein GC152_04255 [Alphaproteobacteria bacterium]|nr:hypothetical protein [Alphaproteobacteria bacterium]
MILQRLATSIRKQDWFTVVIETLIVVFGVFIGLQVNNWNEARQNRTLEQAYLAGIASDLENDIDEIDEIARIAGIRLSALGILLETAEGNPLPDVVSSARGLIEIEPSEPFDPAVSGSAGFALFVLTTLEGHRLTYDTMINTGGAGIVRDRALLRRIQGYYAIAESTRDFEDEMKDSRLTLVASQQAAGLSAIDEMPPEALATFFAEDPALLAAARNYWIYTNRHLKLMKDLRTIAVTLRDEITGETAL